MADKTDQEIARDRERQEFLAEAMDDFDVFCSLLEIIPKDKSHGRKKFELNPIQALFNIERTGRDIVLKPRQIGFSTLELARDVWYFLKHPGAHVLIICQSQTDNGPLKGLSEIVNRYFDSLRKAGMNLKFTAQSGGLWTMADRDASLRILVAGASETAADKGPRSGTIDRLHCTEIAYWEFPGKTMNAALESVPASGEIVIESTPNGSEGLFYTYCKDAEQHTNGFKFHFYPWYRHPEYKTPLAPGEVWQAAPTHDQRERELLLLKAGCTIEQVKWYRHKVQLKGADQTDQEYPSDPETCFLVSGRTFFDKDITSRLLKGCTREPISTEDRGRVIIWKKPEPDHQYVLAVDTSEGDGGDSSGGVMYDRETGEHVATISGQYAPKDLAICSAKLAFKYNIAQIAVERNNHGHSTIQALQVRDAERPELNGLIPYNNLYVHVDGKVGWLTNEVSRTPMLDGFEDSYRNGFWKSPDRLVISQCRTFVIVNRGAVQRAQAANGSHDDLVISAAMGWAIRQSCRRIDLTVGGYSNNDRSWGGHAAATSDRTRAWR